MLPEPRKNISQILCYAGEYSPLSKMPYVQRLSHVLRAWEDRHPAIADWFEEWTSWTATIYQEEGRAPGPSQVGGGRRCGSELLQVLLVAPLVQEWRPGAGELKEAEAERWKCLFFAKSARERKAKEDVRFVKDLPEERI